MVIPETAGGHAVVRAAGKRLGKEVVLHAPDPIVFEESYASRHLIPTAGCFRIVVPELVTLDAAKVKCARCLLYFDRRPQYAAFLAAELRKQRGEGPPPDDAA